MFDLTPFHPWHLYLFLGVFSIITVGIRSKAIKQNPAMPMAGFMILAVSTVAALIFIPDVWQRVGFTIAAILIAVVGRADEVRALAPRTQLIWQGITAAVLVASGWTIPFVTNPLHSGILQLDWLILGTILIPGSLLAAIWIVFLMNAINWIDGVDGLAASIVLIACLALIAISLLPATQDSVTLSLAIIGAAGLIGFLVWNTPPAKAYLGTIGSWFIGMYVALVAMHGGGKIVTAALVLALPALDALFVIAARLARRQPPWQGDTISHLHHRLLSAGVTPLHITAAAVVVTITLAAAAILVPTRGKIIILGAVAIGFAVAFAYTIPLKKQTHV